MPPTSQPQKRRGRPRKHATAEAVAAAKKKSDQQRYQQNRLLPRLAQAHRDALAQSIAHCST
jgi:hypothetical protein